MVPTRIYRGKGSADKWIFGSLLQCSDGRNYISIQIGKEAFEHNEVRADTVGVCSGWFDWQGTAVFEGDSVVSCFGFTYKIEMVNGGLKAVSSTGFYYEFGHICKPVVIKN